MGAGHVDVRMWIWHCVSQETAYYRASSSSILFRQSERQAYKVFAGYVTVCKLLYYFSVATFTTHDGSKKAACQNLA